MSINSYANDLHYNGIHLDCKMAPIWTGSKRIGSGMADSCPLVCDCDDFGSQDF